MKMGGPKSGKRDRSGEDGRRRRSGRSRHEKNKTSRRLNTDKYKHKGSRLTGASSPFYSSTGSWNPGGRSSVTSAMGPISLFWLELPQRLSETPEPNTGSRQRNKQDMEAPDQTRPGGTSPS